MGYRRLSLLLCFRGGVGGGGRQDAKKHDTNVIVRGHFAPPVGVVLVP